MKMSIRQILIIVLLSVALTAGFSFAKIDLSLMENGFFAIAEDSLPDESYFFPTYPQRLMYLASELSQTSEELVFLNEDLNKSLEQCACSSALSQCVRKGAGINTSCQSGSLKVFGEPCPSREKLEERQSDIREKIEHISFLREFLRTEMQNGLERELKTLSPETAKEIKNNLEILLEESEEIILPAESNLSLLSKSLTQLLQSCQVTCELGPVCGIKACLAAGTGEQKSIDLTFNIGVGLEDLELGQIGIKNIHLGLPEKIELPELQDLVVTIPAQDLLITFPEKTLAELQDSGIFDLSSQSITLSLQALLPQPSGINLSCPRLSFIETSLLPSLPELPEKIEIPLSEIPEIKFCPKLPSLPEIPSIPGIEDIQELIEELEQGIEKIEEKIETITDLEEKLKLGEQIETLEQELEKVKGGVEIGTPGIELGGPEVSGGAGAKIVPIETNATLPQTGLSSSYQCSLSSSNQGVEQTENPWYFQGLSWLMEQCQKLPGMTDQLGLKTEAASCLDPQKLLGIITSHCDASWDDYCPPGISGEEPSEICKKIRANCADVNGQTAATNLCQSLFRGLGESVPSTCSTATLKNKCQDMENKGQKNLPEACKILPLFTGKIEAPSTETYSTSQASCPAQNIGDFPSNLGGAGLYCSLSLPTLPKISLPEIIIPDIVGPEFNVPPFLKIKLPSFIFEDLVLPDVSLCDLDKCFDIFPDLDFQWPFLALPSLSPTLRLPSLDILFMGIHLNLPLPEIEADITLPSIAFELPSLNLANLILPELEIPDIPLPKPDITLSLSSIDISAIFDFISSFLLNAMGIPDFSLCISAQISPTPLVISYPDYYFSWLDFPQIPEIPFCKNIRTFCQSVKTALGDVLDKVKEIEKVFNQSVIGQIQEVLDQIAEIVNQRLTGEVNRVFEEYGQIIQQKIREHLELISANIQGYIDPVTQKLKIPPLYIFLPEKKIIIPLSDLVFWPEEVAIPWPESVKEIILKQDLIYDLPTIPLSKLSYEKEVPIKGPGFQSRSLSVDLGNLGGSGDCLSNAPSGGNPYPVAQFQANLGSIASLRAEINNTSQEIINILEW